MSVKQCLAVQESDSLDHIYCYLHSGSKIQSHLESSMQVPRIARHDEEDHHLRAAGVIIVYQCSRQVDYSLILGQSPKGTKEWKTILACHGLKILWSYGKDHQIKTP